MWMEKSLVGTGSGRTEQAWMTEHSGKAVERCRRHQGALKGNWEKEKWPAYRARVNMSGRDEVGVRLD